MDKILKKVKGGVINATANVLSAPAQIKSKLSQNQSDSDYKTLKKANAYDKALDFQGGKPTEAFKARSLASDVKARLLKNK